MTSRVLILLGLLLAASFLLVSSQVSTSETASENKDAKVSTDQWRPPFRAPGGHGGYGGYGGYPGDGGGYRGGHPGRGGRYGRFPGGGYGGYPGRGGGYRGPGGGYGGIP